MNTNNKHPFKTPEGYFDSFQDNLMGKLVESQAAIPTEPAFKVPANYFETFNNRLSDTLRKETKVITFYPVKKILSIAASIAAVVVIYLGFDWNTVDELSFSDLANTDIEAYFENNDFGLSSYEIAEEIPVTNTEFSDILDSPIKNDNILDYLSENINDLEELNIQDNE